METTFYQLDPEDIKDCYRVRSRANYNTLSLIESGSPILENNIFKIDLGKKKFDIIQFIDSSLFVFSEKAKILFDNNNIRGGAFEEILIEGLDERYYILYNLSKAGPILNIEDINNYKTDSIKFDVRTWNGDDLFTLENTLLIVCTTKVKEILETAKITNLQIRPL